MTLRIETWKRPTPVLKSLAFAFALAVATGTGGTALAASEQPSFTDRVQIAQGVGSRSVDLTTPSAPGSLPSEATSFTARVEESFGITTRGGVATSVSRPTADARYHEPESFTDRAVNSQAPERDRR